MFKATLPLQCITISSLFIGISLNAHPAAAHETGRYSMLETKNGIVRLDKKTGAMATCKASPKGWDCTSLSNSALATSPDNETIEKLRKENLKLKQQLANQLDNETLKPGETQQTFKFPKDEEIDQSIEYMEKMIRKFRDAMKRLQEQDGTPDQEL